MHRILLTADANKTNINQNQTQHMCE